jgi:DNA-binding beta-propeller fold protein YncE
LIYVGNVDGTISVIYDSNDTVIAQIRVGKSSCPILVDYIHTPELVPYMLGHQYLGDAPCLAKAYVRTDSNTISVINGVTNIKMKDTSVGTVPESMTFAGDKKNYVLCFAGTVMIQTNKI